MARRKTWSTETVPPGPASIDSTPPRRPSRLWVLAATTSEARAARSLDRKLRRRIDRTLVTGMGGERMVGVLDRAFRETLQDTPEATPDALLLIGFAGGLDPSLRVGDLVRPGELVGVEFEGGCGTRAGSGSSSEARGASDVLKGSNRREGWDVSEAVKGADVLKDSASAGGDRMLQSSEAVRVWEGWVDGEVAGEVDGEAVARRVRVVSGDRVVTTIEGKRRLRSRTGAAAVDLESLAVARWAARAGLGLTVLRAISDGADDALPESVSGWVSVCGRPRTHAALSWAVGRPPRIATLLTLFRRTTRARRALAEGMRTYLREWY